MFYTAAGVLCGFASKSREGVRNRALRESSRRHGPRRVPPCKRAPWEIPLRVRKWGIAPGGAAGAWQGRAGLKAHSASSSSDTSVPRWWWFSPLGDSSRKQIVPEGFHVCHLCADGLGFVTRTVTIEFFGVFVVFFLMFIPRPVSSVSVSPGAV